MADIVRCAGQSFLERSRKWINLQTPKGVAGQSRAAVPPRLVDIAISALSADIPPSLTTRAETGIVFMPQNTFLTAARDPWARTGIMPRTSQTAGWPSLKMRIWPRTETVAGLILFWGYRTQDLALVESAQEATLWPAREEAQRQPAARHTIRFQPGWPSAPRH